MLSWIMENIGTILITIVLAVIVVLIIRSLVKDKKQGKSSCGPPREKSYLVSCKRRNGDTLRRAAERRSAASCA